MAAPEVKKVKQYPDLSKEPMVEFYLERQQFMDPSREYSVPVTINGQTYHAVFGKRNKLPKPVVEVLKNAKSAIHPMANSRRVDSVVGGEGRPAGEIMQSQTEYQYINDYNVVEEKVL